MQPYNAPWFQMLNELASYVLELGSREDLFAPGRLGSTIAVGSARWGAVVFRVEADPLAT